MNQIIGLKGLSLLLLLLLQLPVVAQEGKPETNRFTKVVLAQKLEEPMQFQIMDGGKVLYAERKGKLKLYDPATNKMEVIADLQVSREYLKKSGESSEGEDGLQGVILDPDYAINHWIYIFYSPKNESVNRLSRFTWKGGRLNLSTEKKVLDVIVQREECCHVGGGMVFDKDKNLLLSTGDNTYSKSSDGFTPIDERPGAAPRDAQKSSGNTNDLRGKILRIHPEADGTYTIPAGNLFPEGTPNTRPEIYTMGNRNPWRLTVDSKTNWLYWGEVGPDGSNGSESRGPRSYDEFNMAKKAGNYGWPYFVGDNQAYRNYDFATKKSGELYDPLKPLNKSPNNTGQQMLPPAIGAMIWYPYVISPEFPEMGSGGRSAVGGPVFHKSDFKNGARVFPAYYEGKWLITDWVRGWILSVTLDELGNYKSMERFLPDLKLYGAIDMKFGPDGSLYVLEYGNGYFKDNPEAELIRIEFNGGNRKPAVQVAASKTAGALPLKVNLSSAGTADADGDSLKYDWKISRAGVVRYRSQLANPELLLNTPGIYKAVLTVTDPGGAKNSKTVEIAAGNAVPVVKFDFISGNSSFYFPGKTIRYAVSVTDKEDGSLASKRILSPQVAVSINYLSEGYDMTVIAQQQKTFDVSAQFASAKGLIKKSDCNACHALDTKSLGPSFKQVALKYQGSKTAEAVLAKKVISGGSGVWGDAMMPAHSSMSQTEVNSIIKYILSLSKKNPVGKNLPVKGTYTTNVKQGQTNKGTFIFRAAYKDRGTKFAPAQFGEHIVVLKNPNIPVNNTDGSNQMNFNKDRTVASAKIAGAFLQLKEIDLTELKGMEFVMAGNSTSAIEVHLDSPAGPIIGKTTNGSSIAGLKETKGKHNLWLVFTEKDQKISFINMLGI
ncbi:PQQ-dependent sugar dehydrogenase [Pedobacter metabolipauper]|nr:PQQ-dependent sugar dehydrogenase [Pedobacter metabolipauper]